MTKKQKNNLRASERTTLITCTIIILAMSVTTFGFLAFWYLLTPLLIVNAFALLNKLRIDESLNRALILINILAAAASIYYIVGWHAGWLLV